MPITVRQTKSTAQMLELSNRHLELFKTMQAIGPDHSDYERVNNEFMKVSQEISQSSSPFYMGTFTPEMKEKIQKS